MFYSQFILAKKGPLGTIWIAAHLERKLRKNQVADTDIGVSVDSILFPDMPIALRLSSHLLLGVVRIYSRKVNYLFDDCSEALLKVKQAFRSTAVDLPPEQSKAPYHSITLPETFDLDDFELPDNELFQGNYVDHHVSSREQITLQDTMDGVAFPTSQFGPDERFGDGDASQIGLDLDEDLFMDKGEAAGTSGILMGTDSDAQACVKDLSPKGDTHDDRGSDLPSASPANYFGIQAPSTPGLMEEPNLPSVQEALVSDDHMEEDQNPSELAAKEVSGTASSQAVFSNLNSTDFHSEGISHPLDEQDDVKARSESVVLSDEALQLTSSSSAQLPISNEPGEAANGMNSVGDVLNCSSLENGRNMVADGQSKGHSDPNELCLNEHDRPSVENVIAMEVHGCDPCAGNEISHLNGTYAPMSDTGSEYISSNGPGVLRIKETDRIVVSGGCESQNADQPCINLQTPNAIESNGDEKLSAFNTPVLQACNSHVHNTCDGVNGLVGTSNLSAVDDGFCSVGVSGREDTTNVSGISTDVQGISVSESALKADQISHQVHNEVNNSLDGQLDNVNSVENNSVKQDNSRISDFSGPEKLLSMPDLPTGQANNLFIECTPGKENPAEGGDVSGDKLLTGRKRSYTESTLTIQSLNSAESSGAAQSKHSADFVPDDDDLLSSILAGKRSTTLKMRPTPPVTDTLPTKRQRTAVRSSAHKRKVLVDDTMVLHGDTIREQLTNTEDIRRVRKKAPCTRLEVWVLQKQFLEDEIFSNAIFTGISPDFRSLNCEALDLSRIKIVQDDKSKGANQTDASTSQRLAGETESEGTCIPSVGRGEVEQEHEGRLLETPLLQESSFVVDGTLQKEMESFDNEVAKEKLQHEEPSKKFETEIGDGKVPDGGEANNSVALGAELIASVCPISESDCNLTDNAKVDSPYLNKTSDVVMSEDIDPACQLLDQGYHMQSTREDAPAVEDVPEAGSLDQEVVKFTVPEKQDSEEKSDGKHLLEKTEALDTVVAMADFRDTCSLPVDAVAVTDPGDLEDRAYPTSDKVPEECPLDEPGNARKEENFTSDLRYDGSSPTPNNLLSRDMIVDSSYSMEADLGSQYTKLNEKENLECWEADPKIVMDSAAISSGLVDPIDHADFETEANEHDTDFLNVDDDEVTEDYESDMPNPEEKRILDNSGWSARTRAVANYLQVLFEKEAQHPSKVVSLESLLSGKSRKEASRMFFETLVLKTKDYVHAEQDASFCDIKIKPRGKLMKSEF